MGQNREHLPQALPHQEVVELEGEIQTPEELAKKIQTNQQVTVADIHQLTNIFEQQGSLDSLASADLLEHKTKRKFLDGKKIRATRLSGLLGLSGLLYTLRAFPNDDEQWIDQVEVIDQEGNTIQIPISYFERILKEAKERENLNGKTICLPKDITISLYASKDIYYDDSPIKYKTFKQGSIVTVNSFPNNPEKWIECVELTNQKGKKGMCMIADIKNID